MKNASIQKQREAVVIKPGLQLSLPIFACR